MLKQYKDEKGQPLELVHPDAAKQFGYPLSFYTYDQALTGKLNSALYVASATGNVATPGELTFEFSDGDLVAKKTFRFSRFLRRRGGKQRYAGRGYRCRPFRQWPSGFGDDTIPTSYCPAGRCDRELPAKSSD